MQILTRFLQFIIGLIVGSVLVFGYFNYLSESDEDFKSADNKNADGTASKEPLYWVAPMDPNFRRDKPGKSPMGMDLVPVYAESNSESDSNTVKITAAVENNIGVKVASAQTRLIGAEIKATGMVKFDEAQLVHIHPRVEGWIERLFVFSEGETVKKDQPLYEIYSPTLLNAQEEFLSALSRNNIRLVQAAEEKLLTYKVAPSLIRKIKKDKKVIQNVTFFAPQSGVVDKLNIRTGFYVKPEKTLMSIGRMQTVWVDADILAINASSISREMKVKIKSDFFEQNDINGKVIEILPTIDEKSRTMTVRIAVDNEQQLLKPDMFVHVFLEAKSENVLVVPFESVIRTEFDSRVVVALGEGRYRSTAIQLGRVFGKFIEIKSGLNEGDQVVVSAQFLIDSESSRSADLERYESANPFNGQVDYSQTDHSQIDHSQMDHSQMDHSEHDMSDITAGSYPTANVTGQVNAVDKNNRLVNISRGPIPKWEREAATMDFKVANNLSMDELAVGERIKFRFEVRENALVIVAYENIQSREME